MSTVPFVINGKQVPTLKTTGCGSRGVATSDEMAREAGQALVQDTLGWAAADKAAYWEKLAEQVEAIHAPAWVSSRWPGSRGEIVFFGKMIGVHGFVIRPDGTIVRVGRDVSVKLDISTGVVTVIDPPGVPPPKPHP